MRAHMITITLLVIAIALALAEILLPALAIFVLAVFAEFAGWIKLFKSIRRIVFSQQ